MKKILLGVIVLTVFFMSGCDMIDPGNLEDLPILELVGDIDVTIGLNEEYVDPGVQLVGNFELDITTDSNLDITTYGIYYIMYSINFDGVDISVGRKIRVVPQTEIDFNIEMSMISIEPSSLTFSVSIDDTDSLLSDGKAVLYLLEEKVGEYPLVDGENILEFKDLANFTYYRLELEGTYTEADVDYTLDSYSLGAKTTMLDPGDNPRLELVGEATITLQVGDEYVEQGVTIIGDFDLEVTTLSDVDTSVAGTYYIVYTVEYNLTTFYAHRTVVVEAAEEVIGHVTTVELGTVTAHSITYIINLTDDNNTLFNTVATLYLGTQVISEKAYSKGETTLEFKDLLANTTYNLVIKGAHYENGSFVAIDTVELSATTLELSVIEASIGLNGDAEMTLEVGDTFTDPGAFALGATDVIIGVTSDLDLTTPGTYTIEYSFVYNSKTYSISRTIIIVEKPNYDIDVTLTSYDIGTQTIDVVVEVGDDFSQITAMTITVYEDDYAEVVHTLVAGTNTISFVYLGHETDYSLVVEYTYVPFGTTLAVDVTVNLLDFTTDTPPKPVLNTYECQTFETEVVCTFDWDTTGFNSDIIFFAQLWSNGSYTKVNMFTDLNTLLTFENLNPKEMYTLKVFSNYTITDTGEFYASYIMSVDIETPELVIKNIPSIDNIVYTYTPSSITVDFDVIDVDGALISGFLRLPGVEDITYVVGHNTLTFETGVQDNKSYQLDFRMNYDIGEGWIRENIMAAYFSLVTPPNITLDSFNGREMFFAYEQVVLQIDLGNDDDFEINYVTINGNTYDVYSFPSDNGTIFIDVGAKNSGTYSFTLNSISVTVNEEEYLYNYDTDVTLQVYVAGSISPDDAYVKVIDITTEANGGEVFIPITGELNEEIGEIDVYVHLENEYGLTVTGISLFGRVDEITNFEILSPTLIKVSIIVDGGHNNMGLLFIEYTRNGETIHDVPNEYYIADIYGYVEADVISIYTVADLEAMTYGNSYRLMNDIDLAGATWTPLGTSDDPFQGFFDGNGYTISNFTITKHIAEGDPYTYVGFFGYSNGFIGDLTLHNASLTVTTDDETVYLFAGLLVGKQSGSSIVNVHVTGLSTIDVTGLYRGVIGGLVGEVSEGWKTVVKDSSAYVDITVDAFSLDSQNYTLSIGGLVGSSFNTNIFHSKSTGSITVTNSGFQTVNIGGLVGYMYGAVSNGDDGVYIMNSYSNVDITSSGGVNGGLLGTGHSVDSRTILINTFATGDVLGTWGYSAGLVGKNYGEIHNSFSTGDVNATYGSVGAIYANDSFSWNYNSLMHNVYQWDDQPITKSFVAVGGSDVYIVQIVDASITEFNSVEFYTDIVGLNPYFFDFSSLDILLDHLPTF